MERLQFFGRWLKENGHAIYGARPWHTAETETACGLGVRFTVTGSKLNVILLGTPKSNTVDLKDIDLGGSQGCTVAGDAVVASRKGNNMTLFVESGFEEQPAHTLTFELSKKGGMGTDR